MSSETPRDTSVAGSSRSYIYIDYIGYYFLHLITCNLELLVTYYFLQHISTHISNDLDGPSLPTLLAEAIRKALHRQATSGHCGTSMRKTSARTCLPQALKAKSKRIQKESGGLCLRRQNAKGAKAAQCPFTVALPSLSQCRVSRSKALPKLKINFGAAIRCYNCSYSHYIPPL